MIRKFFRTAVYIAVVILIGGSNLMPNNNVSAATKFTFNGSMSKEVLRSYVSRAVTSWIVLEGNDVDPIFEDDLRMSQRIGAKYLGRAASFSWTGNMNETQVNEHFKIAKERATTIHKADSEMILQAGVFEIVYKNTINNTPIPSWVFKNFGLPVETRNFRYTDVAFPTGHAKGPGFWGNGPDAAVPKIANVEAQMYFYYNICRYIDAGFEAVHLGQVEMMMDNKNISNATEWDRVTTLGRAYAKTHARRGIVLFDGHSALDSTGLKVGNRLILDIQAAALVPNETKNENGAMKCEISHFSKNPLQWIGRTTGGKHPLGFDIDTNFTILEFDNYGGNGKPGVPTFQGFFNWGYDDITWFALQPEWYRNQFLLECDNFLKHNCLDKEGKQVYFLQPTLRRILTANQTMTFKPSKNYNVDFVLDYLGIEKIRYDYNDKTTAYSLTITKDYRANRQSDGCPSGSNQEDTIRDIFLGSNAPENPALLKVVLPPNYANNSPIPTTTAKTSGGNNTTTNKNVSTTGGTNTSAINTAASSSNSTVSSEVGSTNSSSTSTAAYTDAQGKVITKNESPLALILEIIAGVVALAGAGAASYFLYFKKKRVS